VALSQGEEKFKKERILEKYYWRINKLKDFEC
jgi:hypothetical protein